MLCFGTGYRQFLSEVCAPRASPVDVCTGGAQLHCSNCKKAEEADDRRAVGDDGDCLGVLVGHGSPGAAGSPFAFQQQVGRLEKHLGASPDGKHPHGLARLPP
eukprot:scaffold62691_cov29-Prasinocladus_malaysianus.AAC.1